MVVLARGIAPGEAPVRVRLAPARLPAAALTGLLCREAP
jgi:hypothetical protein